MIEPPRPEETGQQPLLCSVCATANPPGAASCSACGASLSQDSSTLSDALPAATRLQHGTLVIGNVLGQGGFGITYAGHDTGLNRAVAIKEFFPANCARQDLRVIPTRGLSSEDYEQARLKFLEEARVLARFKHPGIVNVHSVFEENNTAYMVMEFLRGKTLAQLLEERGGRLSASEAVGYMEQAAQALEEVHSAGLLHRDFKPDNVMICDDASNGTARVVLIDFGAAREFATQHSQRHSVVVTPGYSPLEQYAQRAQCGAYTDIYSMSATLYHLLSGRAPVAASDRATGVTLTPLRRLDVAISDSVSYAVRAGMEMEISRRPQSAREFLNLLSGDTSSSLDRHAARPGVLPGTAAPVPPRLGSRPASITPQDVEIPQNSRSETSIWREMITLSVVFAILALVILWQSTHG